MYMGASLFMERVWDSKSIPKQRVFLFGGSDIFTKEVCSHILVSRMFKNPRMAVSNAKDIGKFSQNFSRLVTFDRADGIVSRIQNAGHAADFDRVQANAKVCPIVFIDTGDELPSAGKLYEWVKTEGLVVNCERYPEYSDDMRAMVSGMFKAFSKEPSEDVVREVIARAGNDIMVASNLVNLVCASELPLTARSVQMAGEYDRRDDVFELVTALAMKKFDKVFLILKTIMERKESPRLVLDRFAYIFANIWAVLKMPKGERIPWQIQGVMAVNGHESRQLAYLQKLYTAEVVSKIYKLIMEAYDWVLTKGYYPPLALAILMVDIIESNDRPRQAA